MTTFVLQEILDEETVFSWAQTYREHMGHYPHVGSGKITKFVPDAETAHTWESLNREFSRQSEYFSAGLTLATFIESYHRMHVKLTEKKIMHWANVHKRKKGCLPNRHSGPIMHPSAAPDTWADAHSALLLGLRGLHGGKTLEEMLSSYVEDQITITETQILTWVDAHKKQSGSYPVNATFGEIPESNGQTWNSIDFALKKGLYGLPKRKPSDSLYWFISRHRGSQIQYKRPNLTSMSVMAWAMSFYEKNGKLPEAESGVIDEVTTREETWADINDALVAGRRGFSGQSSLEMFFRKTMPHLLLKKEDVSPVSNNVAISADVAEDSQKHSLKGDERIEKDLSSELFFEAPSELDQSKNECPISDQSLLETDFDKLEHGVHLQPIDHGQTEIASQNVVSSRNVGGLENPVLKDNDKAVLPTYDEQHPDLGLVSQHENAPASSEKQTNLFDHTDAQAVEESYSVNEKKISAIDAADTSEDVDLPDSKNIFVSAHANSLKKADFSKDDLLQWIQNHLLRTGVFPVSHDGKVVGAKKPITWFAVHRTLMKGWEDFPVGLSLSLYIKRYRFSHLPVTVEQITNWIIDYHRTTGNYPRAQSRELVQGAHGESWLEIDYALQNGLRGLPRGEDFLCLKDVVRKIEEQQQDTAKATANPTANPAPKLELKDRMKESRFSEPAKIPKKRGEFKEINEENIRYWIDEFRSKTGEFPRLNSGRIENTPHSWKSVHAALSNGDNGLPPGGGLTKFIYDAYGIIGNRLVSPVNQHRQHA